MRRAEERREGVEAVLSAGAASGSVEERMVQKVDAHLEFVVDGEDAV